MDERPDGQGPGKKKPITEQWADLRFSSAVTSKWWVFIGKVTGSDSISGKLSMESYDMYKVKQTTRKSSYRFEENTIHLPILNPDRPLKSICFVLPTEYRAPLQAGHPSDTVMIPHCHDPSIRGEHPPLQKRRMRECLADSSVLHMSRQQRAVAVTRESCEALIGEDQGSKDSPVQRGGNAISGAAHSSLRSLRIKTKEIARHPPPFPWAIAHDKVGTPSEGGTTHLVGNSMSAEGEAHNPAVSGTEHSQHESKRMMGNLLLKGSAAHRRQKIKLPQSQAMDSGNGRGLKLYEAFLACIASGRGTQLVSLAETLTQSQHGGRSQSQRIALYGRLAETEVTMKCQHMALRKM
ncbi:hypothetical protein NQZ68_027262 [Dissostichus eleginoides]|nr:hypothetical protein NQZ68_027262 [Dissostichus eleginoides]